MIFKTNPEYGRIGTLLDAIIEDTVKPGHTLCNNRNLVFTTDFEGRTYVVKEFKRPHLLNRIIYRHFRFSKAKRSYLHANKIGAGISPSPVAYIEDNSLLFLNKSYYISEYSEHDYTLNEVLTNKNLKKRKEILAGFASFTSNLHRLNILHNDYSRGNILIQKPPQEESGFSFKIIDVNRMSFNKLNLKSKLNNFSRIGADNDDMRTIINQYTKENNLPPEDTLLKAINYRDKFSRKWLFIRRIKGKA